MDIRGAVDAAVPTNIIAAKAAEVRANKVNWQSYLQWVTLLLYITFASVFLSLTINSEIW